MACRIDRIDRGTIGSQDENVFYVIHPLDDTEEEKINMDQPMEMTLGVKLALYGLKAYIALVIVLALFRFLSLAKLL